MLATVLVRLGRQNRTPQTGQLVNNRHLFLTVLGGWESEIGVPECSGYGESPLPHGMPSNHCNLTEQKG